MMPDSPHDTLAAALNAYTAAQAAIKQAAVDHKAELDAQAPALLSPPPESVPPGV